MNFYSEKNRKWSNKSQAFLLVCFFSMVYFLSLTSYIVNSPPKKQYLKVEIIKSKKTTKYKNKNCDGFQFSVDGSEKIFIPFEVDDAIRSSENSGYIIKYEKIIYPIGFTQCNIAREVEGINGEKYLEYDERMMSKKYLNNRYACIFSIIICFSSFFLSRKYR